MAATIEYLGLRHTSGRLRWALPAMVILVALGPIVGQIIRFAPLPRSASKLVQRQAPATAEAPSMALMFVEDGRGSWFAEEAHREIQVWKDDGSAVSEQQARAAAEPFCAEPELAPFSAALRSDGLRSVDPLPAGRLANRAMNTAIWSSLVPMAGLGLLLVWIACDRERFCARRGLCPRCLYELGMTGAGRCPECGARQRRD